MLDLKGTLINPSGWYDSGHSLTPLGNYIRNR